MDNVIFPMKNLKCEGNLFYLEPSKSTEHMLLVINNIFNINNGLLHSFLENEGYVLQNNELYVI